jgi:hypothetical protein
MAIFLFRDVNCAEDDTHLGETQSFSSWSNDVTSPKTGSHRSDLSNWRGAVAASWPGVEDEVPVRQQ